DCADPVFAAITRNEKPRRDCRRGLQSESAVSLVSPPIEPVDQRGGDRLDIRPHVFGDAGQRSVPNERQVGAVEARVSVFASPKSPAGRGSPKSPDNAISVPPPTNQPS